MNSNNVSSEVSLKRLITPYKKRMLEHLVEENRIYMVYVSFLVRKMNQDVMFLDKRNNFLQFYETYFASLDIISLFQTSVSHNYEI